MQAVGYLLPLGLAVALSSVPITVALFILLSPNRSRSALPFLIGWVGGMFVVVTLCTLLAQAVPTSKRPRQADTVIGTLMIVVGLAVIVLAVWTLGRARRQTAPSRPGWLHSAESLGPWSSVGIALVLNLRPKALLIAVAAGLALRADAPSASGALVAIIIYTVVGASTVAFPIIATLVRPASMEPRLITARDWLVKNGEIVTGVILLLIGVVIIGMGMARLA